LQQEIETKYPKAYEYVNIKPSRIVTVVDEELTQELQKEREKTALYEKRIKALEEQQKEGKESLVKRVEMLEEFIKKSVKSS
jgi:bacterioferritin (cytochrome b1)